MDYKKIKPFFKYHPDPLHTGAFSEGDPVECQCCGNMTSVYYDLTMYCEDEVSNLCPDCISSGKAAETFDGEFVQDAECDEVPDPKKWEELFKRTPGYISWQGEHWLSCCQDFCAYMGTVGTKELETMGIADEVFSDYVGRGAFEAEEVRQYLVKDGSLCGYLFRCLHCGKYHLWVDAD